MSPSPQWRSQDEHVMWAQHEHIQRVHDMHLLGVLGYATTMKIFEIIHSEIASEAIFGHKFHPFSLNCMYICLHPHESIPTCY